MRSTVNGRKVILKNDTTNTGGMGHKAYFPDFLLLTEQANV